MTGSAAVRAGVVTALVGVVVVAAVGGVRQRWPDQAPATCLPADCFCEAVRPEGLAQPVNTVTSLTYVALGLWALLGGVRARDHETRTLVRAVGAVLVLLGLGSAWYHGTLTLVGQVLDVQGMYLLGGLVVVAALVRRGTLSPARAGWTYLVLCLVLGAAQIAVPESRRVLFALVLLPGIVLEALPSTTGVPLRSAAMLPFRVGVGLLVLAYAAWTVDNSGLLCWPTSILQGHGLWHVLTAVAAVLIVGHYVRTAGGRIRQVSYRGGSS